MSRITAFFVIALVSAASSWGCAHTKYLPGTKVVDNEENRAVLQVIDQYKTKLLEKNIEGLLLLASDNYFEDAGTPTATDDYGYVGLKDVLRKRLTRLKSLRYDIQYRRVNMVDANHAEVEVFMSGAFELMAESGDRYRRVSDYHRFVLERTSGSRWKFLSGM